MSATQSDILVPDMDALDGLQLAVAPSQIFFGGGLFPKFLTRLPDFAMMQPVIATTKNGRKRLQKQIPSCNLPVFDGAQTHCPQHVVESFRAFYQAQGADSIIAIGGGSVLGLGKIMSAEEGAKFLAVPTTLCGSEMTPIFGRKIGNQKITKSDIACQPDVIIYDPLLCGDLPVAFLAGTAMNSLAHSVEAMFINKTADTRAIAIAAIKSLLAGVSAIIKNPSDDKSRLSAMYGGFLGGLLIQKNGIALHHQLCHVLGGLYDIEHGVSNSAALAHVVAYNMSGTTQCDKNLFAEIWGQEKPASAIRDFAKSIHAPMNLKDYGVKIEDAPQIVKKLLAKQFANPPRPLEPQALLAMMTNIITGDKPVFI